MSTIVTKKYNVLYVTPGNLENELNRLWDDGNFELIRLFMVNGMVCIVYEILALVS